jgi:lipooligosaccharide transport system permease protein
MGPADLHPAADPVITGLLLRRSAHVVERNLLSYRRQWPVFVTGLAEPLLYLLSIGIGVGELVGDLPGPGGRSVSYQAFVAPGMLAVASMNGAVLDTTYNFYFKLRYAGTFDSMLATPLSPTDVVAGEVAWSLLRGAIYALAFLVTMVFMGLVESWWAVLAVPAAVLVAYAFAGAGMAATSFMRSFTDFDYINLVVMPMFLFSGTFFPLSRYPDGLAWVVRCTPLYQGVAMERALVLGAVDWTLLLHAAYLAVVGAVGMRIAGRRLALLLTA